MHATLLENEEFVNIIQFKRNLDIDTNIQERTACKDEGAMHVQAKLKLAGSHHKLGESSETDSSSRPPGATNPTNGFVADFWSLELQQNRF